MAKGTAKNQAATRVAQPPAAQAAGGEAPAPAVVETPAEAPAVVEAPPSPVDGAKVSRLQVTSRRAGFRRAGRAWATTPTVVDADDFTPEQVEQLLAEPMLTVLPIADDVTE